MIREAKSIPSTAQWFSFFRVSVLVGLVFLAGTVAFLSYPKKPPPEEPKEAAETNQAAVDTHSDLIQAHLKGTNARAFLIYS